MGHRTSQFTFAQSARRLAPVGPMASWVCKVAVFPSNFLSTGRFIIQWLAVAVAATRSSSISLYHFMASGYLGLDNGDQRIGRQLSMGDHLPQPKVVDVILSYRPVGHQTLFS